MTSVAISDLKASLSEYVQRVRKGEAVMLTDRGIPVAKLVPLTVSEDGESALAELIRVGQIRPAEKKLSKRFLSRLPRVEDPEGRVRRALTEERESGW